jgi:hypothetical protein
VSGGAAFRAKKFRQKRNIYRRGAEFAEIEVFFFKKI